MLADWLNRVYQNNVRLAGILYLHRIGDNRLGGTAMKNLRMFKKLCGDERFLVLSSLPPCGAWFRKTSQPNVSNSS